LYLVADGHGGGLAAQFAADHLLLEAAKQLRLLPAFEAAAPRDHEAVNDAVAHALPGPVQAAVQGALVAAFLATEAAFLASLDATWACDAWLAADDRDRGIPSLSSLPLGGSPEGGPAALSDALPVGGAIVTGVAEAGAADAAGQVALRRSIAAAPAAASSSSSSSSSNNNNNNSSNSSNNNGGVVMGLCNAGSCAVLVCVLGGWLYTAHVGDCRAVLASLPKATAATAAGASAHAGENQSSASTVSGAGGEGRAAKRSRGSSLGVAAVPPMPCLTVEALTSDQNCYRRDEVDRVRREDASQ
jgi:serine/threonine protein phosphatase PrpC